MTEHPAAPPLRRLLMTVDAVGGVFRHAVDMAGALEARGVGVLLVGLGPGPSAAQRAEVRRLRSADLVWLDLPLDWASPDADALAPLPDLLLRIRSDFSIDHLHLNAPAEAAGLPPGVPVVVGAHSCLATWWAAVKGGPPPAAWAGRLARIRAGLARADAIVAPSRAHARAMEAVHGPLPRLTVVRNGIDLPPPSAAPKRAEIVAAGRWWDEGKNGHRLAEAAASLDWPVVMLGATQGPDGTRVDLPHVEAPGAVDADAARRRLAEAAVVAAPSTYEPFGLAVLEGAASGAALVLSDIPTFRELWDGAAVFVDPGDTAAWRAALAALIKDEARRVALGAAARARAAAYTLDRAADDLLAVHAGVAPPAAARLARGG